MKPVQYKIATRLRDVELPFDISDCYFEQACNRVLDSEEFRFHSHSSYCNSKNCPSKSEKNRLLTTLFKDYYSCNMKDVLDQKIREKVTKYFVEHGMNRNWPRKSIHNLDLPGSHMQLLYGQPMDWNSENIYATVLLSALFIAPTNDCCSPEGPVICLWDNTNPRGLLMHGYEASWKNEQLNIPMQSSTIREQGERQAYVTSLQFSKVQKDILAIGFEGGIIEVWGLGSIKGLTAELARSAHPPQRLREPLCRSCDSNIDVRLFSINDLENWDRSAITCLAWHPSQMILCTGSLKGPVCVWSFRSRKEVVNSNRNCEFEEFKVLNFQSYDERNIFSSSYLMNLEFRISPEQINCTKSMAWNPFGTTLAIGTEYGTLGIWNFKRATTLKERMYEVENHFTNSSLAELSGPMLPQLLHKSKSATPRPYKISNADPLRDSDFSMVKKLDRIPTSQLNCTQPIASKNSTFLNKASTKISHTEAHSKLLYVSSRSIFKTNTLGNAFSKAPKYKSTVEDLQKTSYQVFLENDSITMEFISSLGVIRSVDNSHSGRISSLLWHNRDHSILLSGGGQDSDGCISLWRITEIGNIIPLFSIDVESKITSMLWSNLTGELIVSHSCDRLRKGINLSNFSSFYPYSSPEGGRWGVSVWQYCSIDECIYKIGEFGNRPMVVRYKHEYGSNANLIDRDNAYCLLQSSDGKYIVYCSLPLEHVSVWSMADIKSSKTSSLSYPYPFSFFGEDFHDNYLLSCNSTPKPNFTHIDSSKAFTLNYQTKSFRSIRY